MGAFDLLVLFFPFFSSTSLRQKRIFSKDFSPRFPRIYSGNPIFSILFLKVENQF